MRLPGALKTHRPAIARALLLVFAFCAWSLTAPANIALALLLALFLMDVPEHWAALRREPAFLLLVGVAAVTAALALRAAVLFPATASDQWLGLSAWTAPFLFFPVAWWVRLEPERIWDLLIAASLGLTLGVVRKSDWSLLPQVLGGMRYDFGFAALGLAFLAAVLVLGLLLFRARILGLQVRGRPRPALGWAIWGLGLAFPFGLLLATQSRGAAMMLGAAGALYALVHARGHLHGSTPTPRQARLAIASGVLLLALAALLLWSTKGRQIEDWQALERRGIGVELRGIGSTPSGSICWRWASRPSPSARSWVSARAPAPPSTWCRNAWSRSATTTLPMSPRISHLHSVPLEILARFGLVGVLIAVLLLAVLLRAYRDLWRAPPRHRTCAPSWPWGGS